MYPGNQIGKQIGPRGQEASKFQRKKTDKLSWEEMYNSVNPQHSPIIGELIAL